MIYTTAIECLGDVDRCKPSALVEMVNPEIFFAGDETMGYFHNHLSRSHLILFACLLSLFMAWTYFITDAGLDDSVLHDRRVWQTTLGTVGGPFTGAISRGFQSCCLQASLTILMFVAPVLAIAVVVQFLGRGEGKWGRFFGSSSSSARC
ncbi:MAG: hypothetical protein HUJ26_16000 [Planctomycetaceae bacterium]|nr:hypothetical protein [Planctomycetaceae bacterium]